MTTTGNPSISDEKQPKANSFLHHPYPPVINTADYICKEIKRNVNTIEAKELIHLLNHYNKAQNSQKQALRKMTPLGRAAVSTFAPSYNIASTVSDRISGRIQAYQKWKGLVAAKKRWDHKEKIKELQGGDWVCDSTTQLKIMYDIWSNVHYGFVGRYVGFTAFELINGAGFAQLGDNNRSFSTWTKQYISNRFVDFGDADIIGAFDDAEDTQAIKVGMSLFDKFGSIPAALTPQLILDELYFFYQNNKPLHIETCEYHK